MTRNRQRRGGARGTGWTRVFTFTPVAVLAVLVFDATAALGQTEPRACVMLQALDGPAHYVSDPVECAHPTAPASTFKIVHSLIALDTGVVADPLERVAWDGERQPFASWERAHSLDSAVKNSVVWFFRRTAASIGRQRMLHSLRALGYTRDVFEGDVTSFWLNGDLVVSPDEQLRFMRRLFRGELPVERRHVDAVRTALVMPAGRITNASGNHAFPLAWPPPVIVRAKTGNTSVENERVSWIVGHLEHGREQYVFVTRVRGRETLSSTAAADLAARVLSAEARPFPP